MIAPLRNAGVIAIIAWFLLSLITRTETNVAVRREAEGASLDRATLNAVSKILRLCVVVVAGLVALQTLGLCITGALAFGGIGGIAVGFAARELLANFFGGVMLYRDRPFAISDWV